MAEQVPHIDLSALPADGAGRRAHLLEALLHPQQAGYLVLDGLSTEGGAGALLGLAHGLGRPAIDSVVAEGNGTRVVHVQDIRYDQNRIRTGDNYARHSASANEFACHTDCASAEEVPDLMALQCLRPAKAGGESMLLHVRHVIPALLPAEIALLQAPVFPFVFGEAPILEAANGAWRLRYNRHEIQKACHKRQLALAPRLARVLDKLAQTIENNPHLVEFKLQPGQCLLLNNKTVLHGRRAFKAGPDRHLRRVRAFLRQ